jgi:hypothetical protein
MPKRLNADPTDLHSGYFKSKSSNKSSIETQAFQQKFHVEHETLTHEIETLRQEVPNARVLCLF